MFIAYGGGGGGGQGGGHLQLQGDHGCLLQTVMQEHDDEQPWL